MISIILNSRKRPKLLTNLLNSISNNTANLDKIEVLISCDNDDLETRWFVLNNQNRWPWANFEFIPRERRLHVRINNLASRAKGDFIWVLNDDTEIITKDWDLSALQVIESHKNDIIYIGTNCNSVDKEKTADYSSFPMLSKKTYEKLGYFMHPDIVGLGGDVHLWRIFNSLNKIIRVPVDIKHILHETVELVCSPDETAAEMRQNTYKTNFDFWNCDISEDIKRLS